MAVVKNVSNYRFHGWVQMGTDGAEVFVGDGGGPDFRLRDRQDLSEGPLRDRGTDKI